MGVGNTDSFGIKEYFNFIFPREILIIHWHTLNIMVNIEYALHY